MTARLETDCFDVQLVVPSLEAALAFWRDTLGFAVDSEVELLPGITQCRLRAGSALIKLIALDESAAPGELGAAAKGLMSEHGYRGLTIKVVNFDEVLEACLAGGFALAAPVQPSRGEPGSGRRACVVADSHGNFLELVSAPGEADKL